MSQILQALLLIIGSFLLSMLDTFLPFIPPVTPTVAVGIYFYDHVWITTLICGISIGLGSSFILYILKKTEKKIDNKSKYKFINTMQLRVSVVIDNIGYFPIIPLQATSLGFIISYIFLLDKNIIWKKYIVYTIIGRTLALGVFVSISRILEHGYIAFILFAVVYLLLAIYSFMKLFANRHLLKEIIRKEKELGGIKKRRRNRENKKK